MFTEKMVKWCFALQEKLKEDYPPSLRLAHLIGCTQLHKEISEVLDCVPWKFERVDDKLNVEREHLLEEMVDVFNFYVRLLWIHEITPEEFDKAWEAKRKIIENRFKEKFNHD